MRIFDTFIFDNELKLLEHRLRELYEYVDVFVLLEAAETFQGEPKLLNFRLCQERFAWAKPKLRPISLPRLPGKTTWEREAFQRNAIQLGLYDALPDDIILIMDADEIPSRSVLQRLRADGLDRPQRLMMTRHYGRFDTLAPRSACCVNPSDPFPFVVPHLRPGSWASLPPEWWCMPGVAVRFRDIQGDCESALPGRPPHALRRENQAAPQLRDAGRHLSSITSADELHTKLSHFSHKEHADERSLSIDHLARTREYGVHARGWWYSEQPEGDLPDDLVYLRDRLDGQPAVAHANMRRRLVRTWAWIRHSAFVPKSAVRFVDRNFERIILLLLPLLIVDWIRYAVSRWKSKIEFARPTPH